MDIDDQFQQIISKLEIDAGISLPEINRLIWKLNDAALYLSRFLQFKLLEQDVKFPMDVLELLGPVGIMATQIARALEEAEIENYSHEDGKHTGCIECLEDEILGSEEDDGESH